ncbi:chorismate mutase [Phaeovulum sp. W22_SRMD_FR3]|uniref:chorismate mutase n=1 Tax=Phaeovulum sp. W22_SRMD_FR3 TaxID=3240274 RepID=UPI003F997487
MRTAKDISSMAELRSEIDALDRQLVDLIRVRVGYIDRAAELKPAEGMPARIEARVEEVVARVRAHAAQVGVDPALVEGMWRQMIDWSIDREERILGKGEDA